MFGFDVKVTRTFRKEECKRWPTRCDCHCSYTVIRDYPELEASEGHESDNDVMDGVCDCQFSDEEIKEI